MAPKKNFPLRLDPKLHQALEQWAEDEFRSVNGHIEYLLREALLRSGRLSKASLAQQPNEDTDT
ncbi:toxin-antitoxin system HicB family antitoxin [Paenibacillus sp. 2RAB27]|uniref:toxin-antitoxin system HicB family antitoxin n=1 Tax=Paenibacillus sp. 2RAB27 TaxID=3232991 RepID=UPI003F9D880E